jgi:sigma-B regulation protein RsbU (phosphoserine phosphatase)
VDRAPSRYPQFLAVALVVVVLVVAAVVTVSAQRESARASHWEGLAGGIQADISLAHVFLEERFGGDRTIRVNHDILRPLDTARRNCGALRDGSGHNEGIAAVDDSVLRADVAREYQRLVVLRALTVQRIVQNTAPGTPADQRYDAWFRGTLALAQQLPLQIGRVTDRAQTRVVETEVGAVVVLATALLLAAAAVRRRQRLLGRLAHERRAMLESAGEGIVALDSDGTIRFANATAAALLGWSPTELRGRRLDDLASNGDEGTDPTSLPPWLWPAPGERTGELRRRDQTRFPIEYTATATTEQDQEHATVVVTFRDITTRRRKETERETELAELRAMRDSLVPTELPDRPGLRLANCHVPATDGVAGDFYLVSQGPDDTTVLIIGDVAGKGLSAARCAAFVRTTLATFATYTSSPSRLLDLANHALIEHQQDPETLVTAACAIIAPTSQTVTWALAGHAPPVRLDGGAPMSAKPGLPLGLEAHTGATDTTAPMPPGSGLVLFTDGLYEARAPDTADDRAPTHFGLHRISDTVAQLTTPEAAAAVQTLRQAADEFTHGALSDDLCILAAQTEPAPTPPETAIHSSSGPTEAT